MKSYVYLILFLVQSIFSVAQEQTYQVIENVPYYSLTDQEANSYIKQRCKLDIYYPLKSEGYATVVWFHGGGLTGGNKEIPEALKNQGIAVIAVNYRLSPTVKAPAYIEDAAEAVSWVVKNISTYGGDSSKIFVSGHSAGGYLAAMIGLDKKWLAKRDVNADQLAGIIPFSGHAITHFTIRSEQGIPGTQPIVDNLAPLYHVRADAPPLLLITGDRELEILGRYEENAYLMRMMKVAGHKETVLYELDGYNHGMTEPAFPLLLNEVRRIIRKKSEYQIK